MKSLKKNQKSIPKEIKQVWSIFCYFSISLLLAILLANKGWEPIATNQINVKGNINIPKEQIIEALGIRAKTSLLKINPKELESKIQKNLPIQSVAISRRISPLGIDVEILEKKPIGLAFRSKTSGKEAGMIDKEGDWIPIFESAEYTNDLNQLIVEGWSSRNKPWITLILNHQRESPKKLKKIIFNNDGQIRLQTKDFLLVDLGSKKALLKKQLDAFDELSRSLSSDLKNGSKTILDLKNPEKPKLFFQKKEI
ncbi:cell division protein FtsQ/DivIB [Prochlorococcus marinus]|uniref:cell division protein FtsQ/DivIB n=1 Tax=Prochlorococcus marinus TaxID=1219 RepID=UPI0022B352B8|nr:FtsQ-type POTRA domain-containing protein [Prochlorococcus marinus]